jgi:anthranilate phosphoribosyltransferase
VSASFAQILGRLLAREPVGAGDVRDAFDAILSGAWTPVQIGAFAVALRMTGETADVIVGAAGAMRAAMAVVDHDFPVVIDTCGTGGDGSHTLNISTGAAVVVASCGLVVAKHGNRSASSRCGSADVFEALGIPLDVPVGRQGHVLREAGIAFLFAQAHHPALRHAAQTRAEIKTRTIFNVLGPIANPARATHQLLGVYDDALRPVLAHALGRLGGTRAWVVHSEDGLDEVSPCAPTRVSELTSGGDVRELVVSPEDFGIARIPRSALTGADAATNARELRAILRGERHAAREAVVLNAAAALVVATGDEPRACTARARAALDDGAARDTLERWTAAALRAREPLAPREEPRAP